MLGVGYVAASQATGLWQFVLAQALLIGLLGSSATFGPLVADVSLWFKRRRGIAVAVVASGNYLAGTIWPPVLQHAIAAVGWRQAHMATGIFCVLTMLPLALALRRRAPVEEQGTVGPMRVFPGVARLSPSALQALLVIAGLACCIAMSMPQVHIVAYCADLGYGPARGAEMLSLMLGTGVISRLASGLIADRIGGAGTLVLGSTLQCLALFFYLPFDGLASLYVVSALFGLAQGGIVPSYALIVRDHFPAREAGARISLVLMANVVGMAAGGWMAGAIYDLTGSYQAAFLNGIAWNLLNMSIAFWLVLTSPRWRALPA
jgi:MFS family permease